MTEHEPKVERIPLESLVADPGNPRFHSARNKGTLQASLREFGPARSAVVDGTGTIRAGHGTIEAAKATGIKDALVIDCPRDALVVVRRGDWTPQQAACYTVTDNQCTDLSIFDDELLADRLEELKLDDFDLTLSGFDHEELEQILVGPALKDEADEPQDEPGEAESVFGPWDSDNEWEVPTLDLSLQATSLPSPIMKWGGRRRKDQQSGTYHFYTDDYKFWGLSRNPSEVVRTGVSVAIEPNYTTLPTMARAEALWWIHSKRCIARWWQSKGLKIVVDLNVEPKFRDLALLGVPHGWKAYSVRWHSGDTMEQMEEFHTWGAGRAGTDDILFVVFGGGKDVRKECTLRGWGHVPEDSDRARGK